MLEKLEGEKKRQEQIDLAPASQLQRRAGNKIAYDNVKSARAEEYIIGTLLTEPAALSQCGTLEADTFSVPLFRKVYRQIQEQARQGYTATVGTLSDLTSDEMSHIVGIFQQHRTVNDQALQDCVRTVLSQHQSANVSSEDDLMARRKKLQERKGIKA